MGTYPFPEKVPVAVLVADVVCIVLAGRFFLDFAINRDKQRISLQIEQLIRLLTYCERLVITI
jgi:hypothetical protein